MDIEKTLETLMNYGLSAAMKESGESSDNIMTEFKKEHPRFFCDCKCHTQTGKRMGMIHMRACCGPYNVDRKFKDLLR